LKFASVSFYCQVSDTGSVGWASSLGIDSMCQRQGTIGKMFEKMNDIVWWLMKDVLIIYVNKYT
jgi:hypothetical protein